MKHFRHLLFVAALLGVLVAGFILGGRSGLLDSALSRDRTINNEQVVAALKKEQQVVLLSLGIQGIVSEEAKTKVLGVDLPGSDRAQFVQYSYLAKLGLPGDQVTVEKTGEKSFRLRMPEFVFIGHDKEQFKVAVEQNGALSWITPQVDTAALVTRVLSEDSKKQHIADNRSTLEEQARAFYSGIIKGIDPAAEVEFQFAGR